MTNNKIIWTARGGGEFVVRQSEFNKQAGDKLMTTEFIRNAMGLMRKNSPGARCNPLRMSNMEAIVILENELEYRYKQQIPEEEKIKGASKDPAQLSVATEEGKAKAKILIIKGLMRGIVVAGVKVNSDNKAVKQKANEFIMSLLEIDAIDEINHKYE